METIVVLVVLYIIGAVIWTQVGFVKENFQNKRDYRAFEYRNMVKQEISDARAEVYKRPLRSFALDTDPTHTDEPEEPPDSVLVGKDTNTNQPLTISDQLRGRHLYLIGKTRTGKTTLIKNLIVQTIEQGHGLCSIGRDMRL